MATLPHGVRVFLCTQATDMRKSFDGLIAATKTLIDKFVYHTPLYRQHQRLADEGFVLSRSMLDNWGLGTIGLLEPIARAVLETILAGGRLKVDETPIKAGRTKAATGQGKMK